MIQFKQTLGSSGRATGFINPADTYYTGVLSATVNKSVTIPTGANFCIFSGENSFWVSYDGTAAVVPTGAIALANEELNPSNRDITNVTTLNLISKVDMEISIAFYSNTY